MTASAWAASFSPATVSFGPVARALEELQPDLPLQRGDLLAHRRLREVERVGGRGERTARHDLPQHRHALDVEH